MILRFLSCRNFFAGFAERVGGELPKPQTKLSRPPLSSEEFDDDSDEAWSAVDARGRPLAGQAAAAAAFRSEATRPQLDVPPIAAFAGFQSRWGLALLIWVATW